MKKIVYAIFIFIAFLSAKPDQKETITVIKDCTGKYLRIDKKDYPICNSEVVSTIANETKVKATFEKIGNTKCPERNQAHCQMVHEYPMAYWIKVTKIAIN